MNMKKSLGKSSMNQQLKVKSNARNGPSELNQQPGQYSQNQYSDNAGQQLKLNVTEQEQENMVVGGGSFDGRSKI